MASAVHHVWEQAEDFVDERIDRDHLHAWPFRGSYPVDVRFLILDRQHNIPLHRPDHFEIVVFDSGKQGYEIEDCRREVGKRDVIVVGDRLRHRCLPLAVSRGGARSTVLSFRPETVHQGAPIGDDFQYLMPFSAYGSVIPNVIPASAGISQEILDLIYRIQREIPAATEHSRLAIRTYLRMILLVLVGHCSKFGAAREEFRKQNEASERLAPVFDRLKDHYDEPLRIVDAARLCALSPCCFMGLFKEFTGQSYIAYVNAFRVAKAQGLLGATSKPIAEISLEVGFCSQSYFGMIFRRLTGTTPRAYREQYLGNSSPGSDCGETSIHRKDATHAIHRVL